MLQPFNFLIWLLHMLLAVNNLLYFWFLILFSMCCYLTSQWTTMVMSRQSVNLKPHFSWTDLEFTQPSKHINAHLTWSLIKIKLVSSYVERRRTSEFPTRFNKFKNRFTRRQDLFVTLPHWACKRGYFCSLWNSTQIIFIGSRVTYATCI